MRVPSSKIRSIAFGPADCFPEEQLGRPIHLVKIGGLPSALIPCPRCFRPLVQVAEMPLSMTSQFGGMEPWPIFYCPSEDNNQVLSYTVQAGKITVVNYLHGTLVDPEFELQVPLGQVEEYVELREVNLQHPGRFVELHDRAGSLVEASDLFALDEELTQAWLDEYGENPSLVEMAHWPVMLFGSLPPGMIRLPPGPCPLSGNAMTAVGIIANPVSGLKWSSIFLDTMRIAYCQESFCLTVAGGFNQDLVWSR